MVITDGYMAVLTMLLTLVMAVHTSVFMLSRNKERLKFTDEPRSRISRRTSAS